MQSTPEWIVSQVYIYQNNRHMSQSGALYVAFPATPEIVKHPFCVTPLGDVIAGGVQLRCSYYIFAAQTTRRRKRWFVNEGNQSSRDGPLQHGQNTDA